MSELTIRLTKNKITGKREIKMGLKSDASATPLEHEEDHRQLVDRVMAEGTLGLSNAGKLSIDRGNKHKTVPIDHQETDAEENLLSQDNT